MPTSATWIFGKPAVSRALPSFSVIEIIPVSATMKFPPEMPISALAKCRRRKRRAIIVNSSGIVGHGGAEFPLKKRADLFALQVHAGKDEMVGRLVHELLDQFAQIALDDLVSLLLQRGIEMDFLARSSPSI